ncbi:MAG: hypothetical protein IJ275_06180, partial [Ruminococcus sp.]|nr:hypothetical protein [Ruminococcus sp.]
MNKKGFFNRILSNNIALMVLSLLIAFVIWFVINANSQTESNVTISNIPITIDLSQEAIEDGLQVFDGADTTASVEVTGNRITVGSLSASDIQVVALQSNSIIAPGSYTLELSAKKVGVKTNYNFASNVSPSNVTIYVDKYKEKVFDITDDIVYKVEEGYYANTSLSETSVVVSGPETEILAIDKVVVQGTLDGSDGNIKKGMFDLVYLDKDGNVIDVLMSNSDVKSVDVTLTPLPIQEVSLDVELVNAPKNYPTIGINPRKIKIAAEKAVLETIKNNKVIIGQLDFAELSNKEHVLTYDIVLPNGCKNLSDSTETSVSIDLSGYKSKKITVNNFTGVNIDLTKYNVVFNSSGIEITVCGPSELIDAINSGSIIPQVDFTSKLDDIDKNSVSLELPVTFGFTKDYLNCWVYGDY